MEARGDDDVPVAFDADELRSAPRVERVNATSLRTIRARIAADLQRGRDAWPAVQWLARTRDDRSKRLIIAELQRLIDGSSDALLTHDAAADNFASDIVFGRASRERRRIGRAFDFVSALQASLHHESEGAVTDIEFEETVSRRRRLTEDHEARTDALSRLGVEPGKGLPFWEMYMRRRRKKNWGSHGS